MSIAHDAYIALLAELTTRKNEKEIWWENRYGSKITIEILNADDETYVVRDYYDNGKLSYEYNCLKNQRHGRCKYYYYDGQLEYECDYINGKLQKRKHNERH